MEQEKDILNIPDFRDYWFIIVKRKKVIIISVILLTLFGLLRTPRGEPVYAARAKIMIDIEKPIHIASQSIRGLDDRTTYRRYDIEYELMKGSVVVEKTAEMLGWEDKTAVGYIRSAVRIETTGKKPYSSNIAFIVATSTDSQKAKDMANFTVKAYIEIKKLEAREKIKKAYDIFSHQLQVVKNKLRDSEIAFNEFKKKHDIMGIGDVNIDEKSAQNLGKDLIDTRTEMYRLKALLKSLESLESEESIFAMISLISNNYPQAINKHLVIEKTEKEKEFSSLLFIYTERHPLVIQKRTQIDELNKRLKKEFKNSKVNLKNTYDMLKAKEESIMYSLRLKSPEIGSAKSEYHTLKQEVDSNKTMCNTLISSMKELNVYEAMSRIADVRVLEWATLPHFPKREKNRMLVLSPLLGLFLGITLAFFIENMDNTIKTDVDVKQYLDIPVIGVIQHIEEEEEQTE